MGHDSFAGTYYLLLAGERKELVIVFNCVDTS